MTYALSDFWKNLKENGFVYALQIDWEQTRNRYVYQENSVKPKLEEKLSENPAGQSKSSLAEYIEGQYKFRLYGEWIQTRLPGGNLGFLSEGLSAKQQKTGCRTMMLEVLDGRGHQYVLHSQPFEERRGADSVFDKKLVFEYAGETELVLEAGNFSEGPKKVFDEHHAYRKRLRRKNY